MTHKGLHAAAAAALGGLALYCLAFQAWATAIVLGAVAFGFVIVILWRDPPEVDEYERDLEHRDLDEWENRL